MLKKGGKEVISLEDCRKILGESFAHYTDCELRKVLDLLYALAEVEFKHHTTPHEKSSTLHQSIH
jgi:hypothetical protein